MRLPPALLAVALGLAGCAASAPAPFVVAPPPVVDAEPPSPEPLRVVEAEIAPIEPVEAPAAERLRIDRRAVYPDARATEWTLANGLVVVFVEAEHDGVEIRVDASGGLAMLPDDLVTAFETSPAVFGPLVATVDADLRRATGRAESLGEALAAVRALFDGAPDAFRQPRAVDRLRPSLPARASGPPVASVADAFDRPDRFRVVLSGSLRPDWVEAAVAPLATVRGRTALPLADALFTVRDSTVALRPLQTAVPTIVEVSADADWSDLPAARILARALATRADVVLSLSDGRLRLRAVGAAPDALLAPLSDDALRTARADAERVAREPSSVVDAFADLYAAPGRFRPAHRPVEAARLADTIARTPPARVAALLRRLAASPDTAVLRYE